MAQQGPPGAANSTPPGNPNPGPLSAGDPLPILTFTPDPSLYRAAVDITAGGVPPGVAGPLATVPTSQMQDFGQPMGQTVVASGAPDQQDR